MSDFRISQVAASPSMTEPSTSGSERKLDRPAVVLGARSICKSFGRCAAAHQVLFGVDVDVYEGECLAVIGGSGSGKSTLTRIMLGLENADGGTVEYRGTPVLRGGSGLRRLRHDSGLIYQDPYGSLDPRWTVGDIVAEPLSLRRRGSRPDPAGIRENVHAALRLAAGQVDWVPVQEVCRFKACHGQSRGHSLVDIGVVQVTPLQTQRFSH